MKPTESGGGRGGGPSLKARAIAYLSRREHSRLELQRKLAPHCEDPDEISRVLDELERDNWQSDRRFAESYVQRKAARQGTARIMQALGQHRLPDDDIQDLRARLRDTEAERVREVWTRKFGELPADAREYAKQYRFLAGRGFSTECIRRLLGARDDEV
ncbi:MAG: recombination regulator RecX [Alcaligenaceae bacterium]|nr:recombination regulator RecX [Alcaligenaceae bacterium]